MNELIWKKGLPTQAGWYWRRVMDIFSGKKEVDIVYVRNFVGELAIGNSTLKGWTKMEKSYWAGPIPSPEEPTQESGVGVSMNDLIQEYGPDFKLKLPRYKTAKVRKTGEYVAILKVDVARCLAVVRPAGKETQTVDIRSLENFVL